ncbi:hypothetical protein CKM354_000566800 [Cercospora kikuchii]|uniref:Uncharacterized protein n=1 Tax=Cercospora kikuchii TaxID=84275 RepID=A0A9P3CL03_9PEZI|nr:uncharacterized protein CKM354_000566800 [Cercospora kikuchii]GIZ42395.1 hypothetical protein CKM354_000566800 [Cercospora kikuchii]
MPATSLSTTPHEDGDQVQATVAGNTPSMSTWRHDTKASLHRSGLSLNRRLAILVIVPLCLLSLFAIFGIVLYASRRRQSSRHSIRGRHERVAEPYRDDYTEPDESPSASPNQYRDFIAAGLEEHHHTPTKRSDDALSMITEIPTNSVRTSVGSDRETDLHTLQSQRLPSSISSRSQTLDALESTSDDDLHGNLSGLDEDPFVDRAAISGAGHNQEVSEPVSPLCQPLHNRPRINTAASSVSNTPATSGSSQAPVTAINTGGKNGANMNSIEQGEGSTTPGDLLSTENVERIPAIDTRQSQDTAERGRGRLRSDTINTARSSSVSTRQSRLRAADIARSPGSRGDMSNSRSPQAETSASIDDFTGAFRPRSSNHHPPPPPLLDRSSWLGERRRQDGEVAEPTSPLLSPEMSKTHEESSIDGK